MVGKYPMYLNDDFLWILPHPAMLKSPERWTMSTKDELIKYELSDQKISLVRTSKGQHHERGINYYLTWKFMEGITAPGNTIDNK